MKSFFTTAAVTLLLAFAPVQALRAEDAPAAKLPIAVVNIQSIMRDATAAKSVREQLETKQKAYQAELSKKEEALKKEDQELAKQQGALSKEAFEKKVQDFRNKTTAAQKEVQTKKASLDNAFEGAIAQIQRTVETIIIEMSKEKKFQAAIPTSQLLYAEGSLDISAEVLKRLNERLPKVDVKFDAPAAAPAVAPAAGR